MKLIEKFMLKRCSTEVQLMLTRMRERPEDFGYGTGWKKLVEYAESSSSSYTRIERKMICAYWRECQLQRDRKELLARIMQQTINPASREDVEDGTIIMSAAQSRLYAQAQQAGLSNILQQSQQAQRAQEAQQRLGRYNQMYGVLR